MSTTVNGWPVLNSSRTVGDFPRLRKWIFPNIPKQDNNPRHFYLRDGSCGFVLMHNAHWFHNHIERLDLGVWDEWGWAVRPVRGQTSGYSNHAGGVATDLNATRHPIGVSVSHTFTDHQIDEIKAHMRQYDNLVIWGGGWSRPDGMHFELANTSLSRIERLARELMVTPGGQRILTANPGAKRAIMS